MAVDDLWRLRDGTPSKRDGRGRRWRVRVPGYPSTLHRTRAEAQAVELRRLRDGPPTPVSSVTVGELLDRWLVGKSGLSAKGQRACRSAVRQVRPRWDAVLVTDVRRTDVVEWLAGLQSLDMRAPRPAGGTLPTALVPAAGSTRAKALRALSGAMDIALDLGLVESNPCRKISAGPQARRAVVTLSPTELAALAEAAGPHDAAMVWLLGTTGLRIGEACALDVGDVAVKRRRLLVRTSKSGRPREVPVPPSVLGMLELGRPRGVPLFTAPQGGRVSADNWRARVFASAAEAIGRPGLTPHVLRHTATSLAIQSGADVKAVQRMLGHADAALTLDTYAHLWDGGLDEVARRMDDLLG